MRPSPPPKGQATLELALGMIVFVTVLLFGIHFAEVGYLSLKVHEAAVAPIWDSTALRVHKMQASETQPGDFTSFASIPAQVAGDASTRYVDFDGRRSTPGTRTSVDQVFTRIDNLRVRCQEETRVEFDLPRGPRPLMHAPQAGDFSDVPPQDPGPGTQSVLDGVYENKGGISCTAEAHLETLPTLTARFLEGSNGFFTQSHGKRLNMTACAIGRAHGGKCEGTYGILLGDWAFADTEVSGHCPLQPEKPDVPCADNAAYYDAARKVFDNDNRSAGDDSSKFAQFFVGYSPIQERGFFMSYRGEEDGYIENSTPTGEAMDMLHRPRNTGGVEYKPTALRRDSNTCFLGLKKC